MTSIGTGQLHKSGPREHCHTECTHVLISQYSHVCAHT